jgi:hypothetical protein
MMQTLKLPLTQSMWGWTNGQLTWPLLKDILDGMGIVCWWGICQCSYSLCVHHKYFHIVDEWPPIPNVVLNGTRLPCSDGVFGGQ